MSALPASASPILRLTDRQEAFCQAMACNVGGAEAARRAGYSAKGAKQRGAYLMQQQEIRVRVQQIRTSRRQEHQTLLDEAAAQVEDIIADAMENKRGSLALRAVEFRLKLRGVIQDRRIAHHYHMDQRHPDADLEDLDCDPEEELDALPAPQPAKPTQPAKAAIARKAPVVTLDSDLLRFLAGPLDADSLLGTTAATAADSGPGIGPGPAFPPAPRRMTRPDQRQRLTSTTIRPRTRPSRNSGAVRTTSDSGIVLVSASSFSISRSAASRFQASSRRSRGQKTDAMPVSVTPRRMKGATLAGRSMLWARPQAATVPA